ncbi:MULTISPECIES: serine/threonine-protein kinase [Actinosynnema]|uniref:serine/threonine-protein kinase n=1 Tax=Actinosynnema TaxID=40566 RepID=UPI0020A57E96|nr:serine/threonine-protein kinase [Actinosynnema pretiosum]
MGAGRYRLIRELGRGGMGVVWLGQDAVLGRDVAVKELLLPAGVPEAERAVYRERVLREARIASRLSDPAVVTVHDLITEDDQTYVVMELIKAPTLDDLVERGGPLPPRAAAVLAGQLLAALGAAHESGVVHRDVKPGNVMVPAKGSAKLTDFGIAQSFDDPRLTATGSLIGSPAYMSPERLSGAPASPAWDLWALGATLFYATQGRGAFERETTSATLLAVLNERPRPELPPGPLADLVNGLLDPDPDRRLTTERAVALAEQAAGEAVDPATVRVPPVSPTAPLPGALDGRGGSATGTRPTSRGGQPGEPASRSVSPAQGSAVPGPQNLRAASTAGPSLLQDVERRRRKGLAVSATLTTLFALGAVALLYVTVFKPMIELNLDDLDLVGPASSPAMQPVLTLGAGGDIESDWLPLSSKECLNGWLPAKGAPEIESENRVGCYGEHDVQVMESFLASKKPQEDEPYPSLAELTRIGGTKCTSVFQSSEVKGEDKVKVLRYWVLVPTEEAWRMRVENGHRSSNRVVHCFVGRADGAKLAEPLMAE